METAHEKRIIALAERLADMDDLTSETTHATSIELLCELEEAVKAKRLHQSTPALFVYHLRDMLDEHVRVHPTGNNCIAHGCTRVAIERLQRDPVVNVRAIRALRAALKAFPQN